MCKKKYACSFQAQNHFKMMKEANMRASEKMLETRYCVQGSSVFGWDCFFKALCVLLLRGLGGGYNQCESFQTV